MQACPAARFRVWKFISVILLIGMMLAARRPDCLFNAQFFAEDGKVFFAQAFNCGTWEAVSTSYAGYYHLFPRLVAEVCSPLPILIVPLAYNAVSLCVAAVAFSWFYLPQFRYLVKGDAHRLACVVVLPFMPNQLSLMKLSYIQWYVALWALFVALMPLPRSAWRRWALVVGSLLSIWTAPVLLLLLPLWLLRFFRAESKATKIAVLVILSGYVGNVLAVASLRPVGGISQPFWLQEDWAANLARVAGYRVLAVNGVIIRSCGLPKQERRRILGVVTSQPRL